MSRVQSVFLSADMVEKIGQMNQSVVDILMQNKLLTLLVVAMGAYLVSYWFKSSEPFESVQRAHGKQATGEPYPEMTKQHRNFLDVDYPAHLPQHLAVRPARPPARAPEDLPVRQEPLARQEVPRPAEPLNPPYEDDFEYDNPHGGHDYAEEEMNEQDFFGTEMYGQSITNINANRRNPTPYTMDKNQYMTL